MGPWPVAGSRPSRVTRETGEAKPYRKAFPGRADRFQGKTRRESIGMRVKAAPRRLTAPALNMTVDRCLGQTTPEPGFRPV